MGDHEPAHRLAVFDLDGTLAASTEVDAECYLEAVRRELGFELDTDWSGYRHCTDSGILREGVERRFGRPPTDDEVGRVRATFFALLEARLRDEGGVCRQIPGALRLLARLAGEGWHVCIATGGWSTSAGLKLRGASLPRDLPLFSSDLAEAREEIVRTAIARTGRLHGVETYTRVVALGDGVWDVRTARRLGLPFLGVGRGDRAHRLRQEGAPSVVGDFADTLAVMTALGSVGLPE